MSPANPGKRAARRAAERAAAKLAAREPRETEDRREEERREDPPLTGKALEKRLRELNLPADRRLGQRRLRGRRR